MKHILKKGFSLLLIIIFTGLFSSCNYTKNENKNKIDKNNVTSKTKEVKKEESINIKKEINSIQKVKKGENLITIKSKVGTGDIKNPNISSQGMGTTKGGINSGANPLGLK